MRLIATGFWTITSRYQSPRVSSRALRSGSGEPPGALLEGKLVRAVTGSVDSGSTRESVSRDGDVRRVGPGYGCRRGSLDARRAGDREPTAWSLQVHEHTTDLSDHRPGRTGWRRSDRQAARRRDRRQRLDLLPAR